MDTSETYIKMCDCEEIQDEWQFKDGDFCVDLEIHGQNLYVLSKDWRPDFSESGFTWLPRQDQIQEVMNWGYVKFYEQMYHFVGKLVSHGKYYQALIGSGMTCEKATLAFYMHEKHGKVWDGKNWRSNP